MNTEKQSYKNLTRDPISGASDNHPVGTGVGALGGAVAGAVVGSALGPVGTLTGAVIGTVTGAIAGKGIAGGIDPDAEDQYWKSKYSDEPYYQTGHGYEEYGPAYRLGWENYSPDSTFESAEQMLGADWPTRREKSTLDWQEAKAAARASWQRVHHTAPKE